MLRSRRRRLDALECTKEANYLQMSVVFMENWYIPSDNSPIWTSTPMTSLVMIILDRRVWTPHVIACLEAPPNSGILRCKFNRVGRHPTFPRWSMVIPRSNQQGGHLRCTSNSGVRPALFNWVDITPALKDQLMSWLFKVGGFWNWVFGLISSSLATHALIVFF